jgi:hypothetical protein
LAHVQKSCIVIAEIALSGAIDLSRAVLEVGDIVCIAVRDQAVRIIVISRPLQKIDVDMLFVNEA